MSKSVREQVEKAVAAWAKAIEARKQLGLVKKCSSEELFTVRMDIEKAELAAAELVTAYPELFAAAEENAAEVARLRGVMSQVADMLADASYTSEAQASNALRAALQPGDDA